MSGADNSRDGAEQYSENEINSDEHASDETESTDEDSPAEEEEEEMNELQDILADYTTEPKVKKRKSSKELISTDDGTKSETDRAKNIDRLLFSDKETLMKNLAKAVGRPQAESTLDSPQKTGCKRTPAWVDADDEALVTDVKRRNKFNQHLREDKTYKDYLATKFISIAGQPKWAELDSKTKKKRTDNDDDESDEEILRTVGFVGQPNTNLLAPHDLSIKMLKNVNRDTTNAAMGIINSIEFHPTSTAALLAGDSGVATLYAIDGRKNEKLHSIFFEQFPIKCARITPCGTKAVFGSIQRYYYGYDLLTAQEQRYKLPAEITTLRHFEISNCGKYMAVEGRFGLVHLFNLQSHELLHSFHQAEKTSQFAFTSDSQRLICNSQENADVNIFSLRQRRLEHKFIDEGCIHGTAMSLAPNQRFLALGSAEGVVNVYDFDKALQMPSPQPIKTFLNLRTAITNIRFNHSSELLSFSSNVVPNAIRIAHFPSATVFANFPLQDQFEQIRLASFSPGSGFLALGVQKEAPLYRLKHFKNY